MLQFSVFCDMDWLYPDSAHNGITRISLHLPRGGHDGIQLLVDAARAPISVSWRPDLSCPSDTDCAPWASMKIHRPR